MNLELALALLAGLIGLPALWSVAIDFLKYAGVVTDGNAGKWNAAFSILSLIAMLVAVNFFPQLNIAGIDKLLLEIAQFAGIVLGLVTQIFVAKGVHVVVSTAFPKLSYTKRK